MRRYLFTYTLILLVVCFQANAKTLYVRNQKDWDNLTTTLQKRIALGDRRIKVQVKAKSLYYGKNSISLNDIDDANLKLTIAGNGVQMLLASEIVELAKGEPVYDGLRRVEISAKPNLNTLFFDENFELLDSKEEAQQVKGEIEPVMENGEFYIYKQDNSLVSQGTRFNSSTMHKRYNVYRFKTELADVPEADCTDFYITLTRQWATYRHKVARVERGYLYFNFISVDDASNTQRYYLTPDCDKSYKVDPRYRLINNPRSTGIHYQGNVLFVPSKVKKLYASDGCSLLRLSNCHLKSLLVTGFNVIGGGGCHVMVFNQCDFEKIGNVRGNSFKFLNNLAVYAAGCTNFSVTDNVMSDTRIGAVRIAEQSKNSTVSNNVLRRIGWMGQTVAIIIGGENMRAIGNDIEDFYYGAINAGGAVKKSEQAFTFRIEGNKIGYSKQFSDNYVLNTVCDGGAIYIGPQIDKGIINKNIIYNYCGNGANSSIYLDDGCKNLEIRDNVIIRPETITMDGFDINLRLCKTYESIIPDHNTNNVIEGNIVTGYYKFQGIGEGDGCRKGKNYVLDTGVTGNNTLSVFDSESDQAISGCAWKDGKITVPAERRREVEGWPQYDRLKKYIKFEQ